MKKKVLCRGKLLFTEFVYLIIQGKLSTFKTNLLNYTKAQLGIKIYYLLNSRSNGFLQVLNLTNTNADL